MTDRLETLFLYTIGLLNSYRHNLCIWKEHPSNPMEILSYILTTRGYLNLYVSYFLSLSEDLTNNALKTTQRLQSIKQASDHIFQNDVVKDSERIENTLVLFKLSESEALLVNLLVACETMSTNDAKDQNMMNHYAQSFLNVFLDEKLLYKELNSCFGNNAEGAKLFFQSIDDTSHLLKSNFYYWSKLQHVRETFIDDMHKPVLVPQKDFWWLFDDPMSEAYTIKQKKAAAVADQLISLSSQINWQIELSKRFPDANNCPDDDQLVLFVSEELDDDAANLLKKHLLICDQCAHEVAVLQPIIQSPVSFEADAFILPETVKTAMEKEFSVISSKNQSFSDKVSKTAKKVVKKVIDATETIKDAATSIAEELIIQMTPGWEPVLVGQRITAADITKQKHKFYIESGSITIHCNWKPENIKDPAYLCLSWKANLSIPCNLWARFENPDTHDILSEICLGASMVGEEYFTENDLGFDPSKKRWAVSMVLTKT